jgi:hypothetical protein
VRCLSPPLVLLVYAALLFFGVIQRSDLSVIILLVCEAIAIVLYVWGTRVKLRRMREDIASR